MENTRDDMTFAELFREVQALLPRNQTFEIAVRARRSGYSDFIEIEWAWVHDSSCENLKGSTPEILLEKITAFVQGDRSSDVERTSEQLRDIVEIE